jgi:hypothetical protein
MVGARTDAKGEVRRVAHITQASQEQVEEADDSRREDDRFEVILPQLGQWVSRDRSGWRLAAFSRPVLIAGRMRRALSRIRSRECGEHFCKLARAL